MKRTRRNQAAEYKAKVALAAIRGDRTLAELAVQDLSGSARPMGSASAAPGISGIPRPAHGKRR